MGLGTMKCGLLFRVLAAMEQGRGQVFGVAGRRLVRQHGLIHRMQIGAAAGRPRLVTAAQDRFSSMTEVAGVGQDRGWKGAVACCISSALLIRDRTTACEACP